MASGAGTRAARALWVRRTLDEINACNGCPAVERGERCYICRKVLDHAHWRFRSGTSDKYYGLCAPCAEPFATLAALRGDESC